MWTHRNPQDIFRGRMAEGKLIKKMEFFQSNSCWQKSSHLSAIANRNLHFHIAGNMSRTQSVELENVSKTTLGGNLQWNGFWTGITLESDS